jgi:hypothetical protein
MSTQWFNADGLKVDFGRENTVKNFRPYAVKTDGVTTEVIFKFDLSDQTVFAAGTTFSTDRDNDGSVDGFNTGDFYIPDQHFIESAVIYMSDTAGASGTNISVGTYQVDGTAIDADGLVTTTNGATANLSANNRQAGSGAQVGGAVTQDAYVAMTVAGTYTAGIGELHIKLTKLASAV